MSVFTLQPSCHSLATDEACNVLWETGEKQRIHERNGEVQKFLCYISLEPSRQRMVHHTLHGSMCDEPPSMSAVDQIYTAKSQSFRYFIFVKTNVHLYRRRVVNTTFETQTQLFFIYSCFFCFETLI